MERGQEWLALLTGEVGQRLARFRSRRGMTAQAVADRCTDLGLPMDRATVSKLERGLRVSLHIGELLVLAEALEVPPLLLVIPVASEQTVEILPGQPVPTWEAALWWRGEGTHIADLGEGPVLVKDATSKSPVDWVLQHQDFVARWEIADTRARNSAAVASRAPESERDAWLAAFNRDRDDAGRLAKQIAELRQVMRSEGLIPPPLPFGGLDHADVSDATQS